MLYVLLLFLLTILKENKCALRLIGGKSAEKHEFHYVGAIEERIYPIREFDGYVDRDNFKYMGICTCTIITPNWTLTAAHCTRTFDEYIMSARRSDEDEEYILKYVIRYRSPSGKPIHEASDILSVIKHPAYKDRKFNTPDLHLKKIFNDICLLRTESILIKEYGKLSAIDYSTLTGLRATAVGFGLVNYTSEPHQVDLAVPLGKRLQVLEVIVVKCPQPMIADLVYPSICLVRKCGQRSTLCPGDSGGPLLHSSGVIGVNSIRLTSCETDKGETDRTLIAGGITVISPFIEWIQREIIHNGRNSEVPY